MKTDQDNDDDHHGRRTPTPGPAHHPSAAAGGAFEHGERMFVKSGLHGLFWDPRSPAILPF